MSILYIVIVFYLKFEYIINGNKQELMIIKEVFEGPVGTITVLPAILSNACFNGFLLACPTFHRVLPSLVKYCWQFYRLQIKFISEIMHAWYNISAKASESNCFKTHCEDKIEIVCSGLYPDPPSVTATLEGVGFFVSATLHFFIGN